MNRTTYPLLFQIDDPSSLRQLPIEQLDQLCNELRHYLIDSVSQSSGHLASGLGTVELTVALHYIYQTPIDRLIWDVGHQAYPHKILTGRRDQMHTIRQKNGLHPFPYQDESEYDVLTVGHSSTSISAALGLAIAAQKEQQNRKIVSVIGDGALTAGMAFEALNHAGGIHPDMLVILNDNEMSISENVGGLRNHLTQILSGSAYTNFRENSKKVLSKVPAIRELVKKTEEHLKGMVSPSTLFEEVGFNYIGPIDGHNVNELVHTLKNMRQLKGPQLLHVITQKGKGYAPAEQDPISYHGVPSFDPATSALPQKSQQSLDYSSLFGEFLCDMAAQDTQLMAITPAMREGSGMTEFQKCFPDQFFDVAIAEQHAVTLATGFALAGYRPIVAIYSTFLQRAYDQLIHDVALTNLPVLFAIDRAGIVGADGQTHQGAFDISFMRCIPNMVIMTPSDENYCRQMLYTGYQYQGPAAVRYPKGNGMGVSVEQQMTCLPLGKGNIVRHSSSATKQPKIAILNFGPLLPEVCKAAEQFDATVADMLFVKPLDNDLIAHLAQEHDILVTVEENTIKGGAGSAVIEQLMATKTPRSVLTLGLPDQFIPQGTQQEILGDCLLNSAGIAQQIETYLN